MIAATITTGDAQFTELSGPDLDTGMTRYLDSGSIICSMRDIATQEADAKLIAASPDLADACKLALAQFGGRPVYQYTQTRALFDALTDCPL